MITGNTDDIHSSLQDNKESKYTPEELKRILQERHSIKRLMERHGLLIDSRDYEILCETIHKGYAQFFYRMGRKNSVWFVTIQGEKVPCIYNHYDKRIVTFCNKRWIKKLKKEKDLAKIRKAKAILLREN